MRLTIGCGPDVLLEVQEKATLPVLIFIPPQLQQTKTSKHAET